MKKIYLCFLLFVFHHSSTIAQCTGIDLSFTQVSTCLPSVVDFRAINAPSGSAYTWNLGNGNSYSGEFLNYTYNSPGSYSVTLTVKLPDNSICTVTRNNLITILSPPAVPEITASDTLLCHGAYLDTLREITFTNNSPHIKTWNWIIDGVEYKDGGNPIVHPFDKTGCFDMILEVVDSAGCKNSKVDFSKVCIYFPIRYALIAPFMLHPIIATPCGGLKANYECKFSFSDQTPLLYEWQFSDGTPSSSNLRIPPEITYPVKGYRNTSVNIKTTEGCSYSRIENNFYTVKPLARIENSTICLHDTLNVILTSRETSDPGVYGTMCSDGSDSILVNGNSFFHYGFQKPGEFQANVSHSFNDLSRCSVSSDLLNFTLLGPGVIISAPDSQRISCNLPLMVDFTSESIIPTTGITTYLWTFFDADSVSVLGTSTLKDPSFTYNKQGIFNVKLVASNTNGCTDSLTEFDFIQIGKPKADFIIRDTIICNSQLAVGIKMQNLTIPQYDYYYDIIFDGPEHMELMNNKLPRDTATFTRRFPNTPGHYKVTYVAKATGNCKDTIFKENYLHVNGLDISISMDQSGNCIAPADEFFRSSIVSNVHYPTISDEVTYKWSNKKFFPELDFLHVDSSNTYAHAPSNNCYSAILEVTNSANCTRKKSLALNIGPSGKFCMIKNGACSKYFCKNTKYTMAFFSCSNDYQFEWWSVPKGVVFSGDTLMNPTVVFPDTIDYQIFLKVKNTNSNGCIDTFMNPYYYSNYHARFSSADTLKYCDNQLVKFDNQSINAVSYQWNFGDISSGNLNNLTGFITAHAYNIKPEGYDVRLIITNSEGCKDTLIRKNYIKVIGPVPAMALVNIVGCDSLAVTFGDSSYQYEKFSLCFGDDSSCDTNILALRNHLYSFPANAVDSVKFVVFHPQLTLSDGRGCTVFKKLDSILVHRGFVLKPGSDTASGCPPLMVEFVDSIDNPEISYSWDFGDGQGARDKSPAHQYENSGNYNVVVTATSPQGCTRTVEMNNFIHAWPVPVALFEYSPADPLVFETVFLKDNSLGSKFSLWDFGDGHYSLLGNPDHVFSDSSDNYKIKLLSTNDFGCKDSMEKIILLIYRKVPNIFSPNGDGYNDIFNFPNQGLKDFNMVIYDRWGKIVFSSSSTLVFWDGKIKGENISEGVYYYVISGELLNSGKNILEKGFITLTH